MHIIKHPKVSRALKETKAKPHVGGGIGTGAPFASKELGEAFEELQRVEPNPPVLKAHQALENGLTHSIRCQPSIVHPAAG